MIKAYESTGEWYGRLEDLVEDIEDQGYEVDEANSEYISCYDPESEKEFIAYLGGTESTIYIDHVKEV